MVNVSPSAKARVEVKVYVCESVSESENEVACVKLSMRDGQNDQTPIVRYGRCRRGLRSFSGLANGVMPGMAS